MWRTILVGLLCGAAVAGDDLQTRVFRARDRALPALVNVQPVLDVYRGGRRRRSTATGSGVIVREDGLVVTNFHVAGHARKIYCTLADKTRVPATLLGGDPATDLAVLRLDLKAVARLGGRAGAGNSFDGLKDVRGFLLGQLAGGKAPTRPWAGLALGVLEFALNEAPELERTDDVRRALRTSLERAKSPDEVGALSKL